MPIKTAKKISKKTNNSKIIDEVLNIIKDELTWETEVPHIARMIRRIKKLK